MTLLIAFWVNGLYPPDVQLNSAIIIIFWLIHLVWHRSQK